MSGEGDGAGLHERAAVHGALGDPIRLAVAEALLLGDRSPKSLAEQLALASNLLAHHINVLVDAGVVVRSVSQADRRRVFLHLATRGRAVLEAPAARPIAKRVVFICTHNAARSQFAEALWRRSSPVPAMSAGVAPAERVHPLAVKVAARHGIGLEDALPQGLELSALEDALVVTVCDSADAELIPMRVDHLHWSIPDPVRVGTTSAFEAAWAEVAERVALLVRAVSDPRIHSSEEPE